MVYTATAVSVMRYGLSTMTLYSNEEKQLAFVHFKHLRSLLGYTWRDKRSYCQLLDEAEVDSIQLLLRKQRLSHAIGLAKSDRDRLPFSVLCGELTAGKRRSGGQYLNFRRLIKKDMAQKFGEVISSTDRWKSLI